MRASLPALLCLAVAAIDETARAADTEDVALAQVQPAPQQPPTPPWYQPRPRPEPPPLFQPRLRPQTPMQAPRAVGPVPCVHYTMRIVPADPSIDPKFVKPAPADGTKYSGHVVTPPPACR